ncbi:MAG: histidine ammonia-lyase [Armatimonadetes bacterium]|nr:histidine ammonia-lyase [Armatimonadota bacterium]
MPVEIGTSLSLDDVDAVATRAASVVMAASARRAVAAARAQVDRLVAEGRAVYAITTGVGQLASVSISPADAARLQLNIVRSHAAGVGPVLAQDVVRAMMLLRAHALALGHSGVRQEVIDLLVACLNRGIHPVVPEQGSVGASGDLAPLAHLALAVIGEGEVVVGGERQPAGPALERAGLRPLHLVAKEGVALVNGTQLMTAYGALASTRARRLCITADVAGAMSLEALRGRSAAFDPRLHRARPHPGQQASAANIRRMIAGSALVDSDPTRVQDAYSLRCMPQVHGATRDAAGYAARVVEVEINAATDNPLLFPEEDLVLSGGNFHGQPVALALDFLAAALAGLGTMTERRIERLVNPALSGLPAFLSPHGGLHSGLMLAQYTAAALASENKILAHPASADSIPTSANQEDHVSMGAVAARKAAQIVAHVEQILGIELLCAAQALEFRGSATMGRGTAAAYAAVREGVPPLDDDRVLAPDLEAAAALVRSGAIVRAVEQAVGPLV